ncbi:SUF system NifU family Fe-S cluster assembly protein [Candidatus Woesearchaeota archaeon]|nr:SUF system NifU family Fe-S cluster assembly protein [Candidatus Woesearchaeota archaeon]
MKENLNPDWLGSEEGDEIYRENIIDHFKNPRNYGEIVEAEIKHSELNAICGDMIRLFVKFKEGKVEDVKFKGNGCAISMATTSMMTEILKEKTLEEIKKLKKEDIFEMLGIKLGVVRMKCGLLCLNTLMKGVEQMEGKDGIKN